MFLCKYVHDVSLQVMEGETLGLIGESGSGKSTLLKAIAGLVRPSSGKVQVDARSAGVQVVSQDAGLALNPRLPVWRSVAEPLAPKAWRLPTSLLVEVESLFAAVGLPATAAHRRPHQLSGGQRQRVTIARALAAGAPIVLLDEPVSGQDVSIQTGLLRLLKRLRDERHLTYLMVSHDLGAVARLASRVGVMYAAELVEIGPSRSVLTRPAHPYTMALMAASPRVTSTRASQPRPLLQGEVIDLRNLPGGCRFRTRCPFAIERCVEEPPALRAVSADGVHEVACHRWEYIRDRLAAESSDSSDRSVV
jgi:oligopeptide/dipeptide ABC transporter ATP-binding protein